MPADQPRPSAHRLARSAHGAGDPSQLSFDQSRCRGAPGRGALPLPPGRGGEAGSGADIDDTEGEDAAVMLAHRDILAGAEDMIAEAMDRLVVLLADAEGEGPAVAAPPLELPDLIALALPEAVHGADLGIAGIGVAIEPAVLVERQDEGIAMARAAIGKIMAAREFEANAHIGHGFLP